MNANPFISPGSQPRRPWSPRSRVLAAAALGAAIAGVIIGVLYFGGQAGVFIGTPLERIGDLPIGRDR